MQFANRNKPRRGQKIKLAKLPKQTNKREGRERERANPPEIAISGDPEEDAEENEATSVLESIYARMLQPKHHTNPDFLQQQPRCSSSHRN